MSKLLSRRNALNFSAAVLTLTLATGLPSGKGEAAGPMTVVYVAPSLDISYWQWVAYGVREQAAKLGMNYVEFTSENSPGTQMNNIHTALTRGVSAVVIGPVSSSSTPPVLRLLAQRQIPVAFTGIGPQPGLTDYTSSVTADNYGTGKAEGDFVCKLAKARGSNKVGCCRCRRTVRMPRNT